jgi:hypothetical protein
MNKTQNMNLEPLKIVFFNVETKKLKSNPHKYILYTALI